MSEHILWLLRDISRARKQGRAAIMQRQRTRLAEMVAFARTHSPYYRELYQGLPEKIEDPQLLPVTSKKALMANFNDWCTDRDVTIEQVHAFISNPDLIGEHYLGKYLVATTSGTTGTRGIFLLDTHAIAVNLVLTSRAMLGWLSIGDVIRVLADGGRMATVGATGGHFLSCAGFIRLSRSSWWLNSTSRFFSAHTPLPELVVQLNQFHPAIVFGYGSMVALLAGEQDAGHLHIKPVLLIPSGETLGAGEYDRIGQFHASKVRDLYGATECPFISSSCVYGWHHVNSDWVVLEPVDADYQPTRPGELSHTVLLSNLANRVQPILRYDLGDRILLRSDPCPCGSPLPAIRVQGRAADLLLFPTERGERVAIAPLALGTLVDRTAGIKQFQIVQITPSSLRVRLRLMEGADPEHVWQEVSAQISHLLAEHHLSHVTVERAEELPQQAPGGKFRTIIPLEC
jgi:phenylacetate-coenzyme A ligase PaaK-like adenylate-forming protein